MTQSLEDYLEAIYMLAGGQGFTRVKDIAERLHVSRPSVIQALRHLNAKGLIQQQRYGYVCLTSRGHQAASGVFRRHERLTSFLIALGVSPEVAARDACQMEHVVSEETMEAIEGFLSRKEKKQQQKEEKR